MRNWLLAQLQNRAKRVLAQKKPKVVAITGSMGKTTAREAISIVLDSQFHVRAASKNYNNELGVPLSILGLESPGRSFWSWLKVLYGPLALNDYPSVLVLEFGADHPGDIGQLCELAPPQVGVLTGISTIHAEYFRDLEELAKEKALIISALPADGVAVLNVDDGRVASLLPTTAARVITYGSRGGDWSARNLNLQTRFDTSFGPGEVFAVTTAEVVQGEAVIGELQLKNCLGYAPVLACLSALAVGSAMGVDPAQAIAALNEKFEPVAGRLRPLPGIKGSLIIDDSYNAAPAAMLNALDLLRSFTPATEQDRRIAVLGQMAELGQYTEQEHRSIGLRVAESADLFVAVGEAMRAAQTSAVEAGLDPASIIWFPSASEAGRYLDQNIKAGDILLVKGSQSTRMEKVVKEIMAEPLRAGELLVRQDEKWLQS